MLQAATYSLSALGVFAASLTFCLAVVIGWQRDWLRDNLIGVFIAVLILLGLVIAMGADVNHAQGGLLRQALTGFVYIAASWFATRAPDGTRNIPVRMVPATLVVLLGLAFLSMLWSATPDVTLRRAVQFAGVLIFAVAIVRSFESNDLWQRYLNPLLLWLLVGLVVAPFASGLAFDVDGNFRGLASHKNSWAGIALGATILTIVQIKQRPKSFVLWAALTMSLLTIALTKSATAISLAVAVLGCGVVYTLLLSRQTMIRASLVVGAIITCVLPFSFLLLTGDSPAEALSALYFEAVGKEASLTGRNILWETILQHAWLNPWLGNGYGAFWVGNAGPSVAVVTGLNWFPVHSHNGYIDLFNELGIVGVTIFGLLMAQHSANIVATWRCGQRDSAAFHLVLLLAILGYNLSETSILQATHALWVLLVVSIIDTHRLAHQGNTR